MLTTGTFLTPIAKGNDVNAAYNQTIRTRGVRLPFVDFKDSK